ncbi:MAG TPA: PAS domain S-box protein, partial [Polyangiaceae bacterium]
MSLLLQRQLGKLGLSPGEAPDAAEWRAFLEHVQRTYDEAEQDRYTLERSLMTSSGEMRQLHAELRRSEANFKSLVERLPDAVFVHRDSVLRYANPAMARLLGLGSPAALVGQGARDAFVHPDDRAMLDDFVVRRDAGEDPGPLQIRWVRRDGGVIVVQSVSTAIVFDDE